MFSLVSNPLAFPQNLMSLDTDQAAYLLIWIFCGPFSKNSESVEKFRCRVSRLRETTNLQCSETTKTNKTAKTRQKPKIYNKIQNKIQEAEILWRII